MAKPKLTEKEQAAIAELQALAKKWPRSLLIGGDDRTFSVWKQL